PDEYTYTSTADVVADRLPTLIQPELAAAKDAEALTGMPTSKAKKASSTAARRCVIRNFTLVPSLTCRTMCPPPSPSVMQPRGDDDVEIIARRGPEQAAGHRFDERLDGRGSPGLLQAFLRGRDELPVRGEQGAVGDEVLLVQHPGVLHEQLPDLLQVLQPPQPLRSAVPRGDETLIPPGVPPAHGGTARPPPPPPRPRGPGAGGRGGGGRARAAAPARARPPARGRPGPEHRPPRRRAPPRP